MTSSAFVHLIRMATTWDSGLGTRRGTFCVEKAHFDWNKNNLDHNQNSLFKLCSPMDAARSVTGRQQAERVQEDGDGDAAEDEMPLLFMDRLPSDFSSNAQLAAIATFMQGSDSESDDHDNDDDNAKSATPSSYMRAAHQHQRAKTSKHRRQTPYAKPKPQAKHTSSDTNELQLYLSMFKM